MKTISVVMCTYNGAPYLRQQLDTIINQTYPIHELIVQDDQSTDGTMEILEEYAACYPFMQVHRKQQRKGIADNFLTAMAYATGDYVALSDQDDIWELTKIEEQINAIGDSWICYHPSPPFNDDKPLFNYIVDPRIPNCGLEIIFGNGCVLGHTMLLRRSLFNKMIEHVPQAMFSRLYNHLFHDGILFIVANALEEDCICPITYVNSPLTWHRRSDASVTKGEERRDLSKRTWGNAMRLVLRNINPKRRKEIAPLIYDRLCAIRLLLDCFPMSSSTAGARKMINAYCDKKWYGGFVFLCESVKNRNKIFYAPEKNQFIATLRALLLPITMYDKYTIAYRYKKEGRPDA